MIVLGFIERKKKKKATKIHKALLMKVFCANKREKNVQNKFRKFLKAHKIKSEKLSCPTLKNRLPQFNISGRLTNANPNGNMSSAS